MEPINPKSQYSKHEEKRVNFEQEILSSEFKIVCEKLRRTKTAYNEAKSIIKNDIFSIKDSIMTIGKLVEEEANNQNKVHALQVQKLKETNHIKDEELRSMKKKVKELERRNECHVLKIDKQKKQLQELKCKNEKLGTDCDQTNQPRNNYFSLEKKLNNLCELLPAQFCSSTNSNIKL